MSSRYTPFAPEFVQKAFAGWYAYATNDETYEAFAGKWGGLEYDAFLSALKYGARDDRLCAMFALGASSHPDAASALLPFLSSERRDERCVSAIVLGMRQDARAYPFLEQQILEGLSREERQDAFARDDPRVLESLFLCDRFRPRAVQLLTAWHSSTLVSTMLQALQALWAWEKEASRLFGEERTYTTLLYALGQKSVFSALDTVDFPPAYRRIAQVYLALGALQAEPVPTLMRWVLKHEEQTKCFLEETFHLDKEKAQTCIETFYQENEVRQAYQAGLDEQAIANGLATHFMVPADASLYEDLAAKTEEEELEEQPIEQREPVRLCFNREHTSTVWSLAWSPDGTHIVSGSEDNTVQIWNGHTGKRIMVFREHTACVTAVSWSPDGQWIASGGCDKRVLIWNAWSGEVVTTYTKQSAWIWNGLAWSPDSVSIASASWDGSVHVWEAMTGKTNTLYREHRGIVTCIAWSPDGTRVVSGGGYPECAIHVWNAFTGQQLLLYKAHMQDSEGSRPILEDADPEVEAWQRGPGSLRGVAWSPNGKWIASVGLRDVFRVWDAQTGEDLIARAQNRTNGPLAWSPDSEYVATGQQNGIDLWHIAARKITLNVTPVSQYILTALAWSPDGKAIATGVKNPRIGVWKVEI